MLVLMDSLRENTAGHRVGGGVKAAVGPHVCVCVCVSQGVNVVESRE